MSRWRVTSFRDVTDGELEPVMLSALQHYLFCPRQCALIHVEGAWAENYLTASGRILHERTDSGVHETRGYVHRATALRLFSKRIGLTGIADVVEFFRESDSSAEDVSKRATRLPGMSGRWRPFPVEYKRGRPKTHRADEVQLCAQALCLEEMFSIRLDAGALFYGETHRRVDVMFDTELRGLTERTTQAVRHLLETGVTPAAVWNKGCEACSLVDLCHPREIAPEHSARRWIADRIEEGVQIAGET